MFKGEVTLKKSSIAVTLFIVAPMITLILWIAAWYATGGVFDDAVRLLDRLEAHVYVIFTLIAIILAIKSISVEKEKNAQITDIILLLLSIILFLLFLFSIL